MSAPPPVAQTIAEFVHRTRPGDLPAPVVHEAKRSLFNFIGCAVAAWSNSPIRVSTPTA